MAEKEVGSGLKEFYAVTLSGSVYHVTSTLWRNSWPIVEKIHAFKSDLGVSGTDPAGAARLMGGTLVGVRADGLVIYDEEHPGGGRKQSSEYVHTGHRGGHTSSIVALFLTKDVALGCAQITARRACDPRWKKETLGVLEAIGDRHPIFIVSRGLFGIRERYPEERK